MFSSRARGTYCKKGRLGFPIMYVGWLSLVRSCFPKGQKCGYEEESNISLYPPGPEEGKQPFSLTLAAR